MITLEKVHYQCPFCGLKNSQFYNYMYEAPPHYFRCCDCLRHFGDESKMSFSEKTEYYREAEECGRTMRMSELATVLFAVETFFRNYRPGYGDLPIVIVRDGKVENSKSDGTPRHLLTTYSVTSPISDQWLCVQCYFHLKKMMPYTNFNLGNYGISMERA